MILLQPLRKGKSIQFFLTFCRESLCLVKKNDYVLCFLDVSCHFELYEKKFGKSIVCVCMAICGYVSRFVTLCQRCLKIDLIESHLMYLDGDYCCATIGQAVSF